MCVVWALEKQSQAGPWKWLLVSWHCLITSLDASKGDGNWGITPTSWSLVSTYMCAHICMYTCTDVQTCRHIHTQNKTRIHLQIPTCDALVSRSFLLLHSSAQRFLLGSGEVRTLSSCAFLRSLSEYPAPPDAHRGQAQRLLYREFVFEI